MLHKKSASERVDAFILAENQKDNGGSSALCGAALEDKTLSDLRTCEVEIAKLRKILVADDKAWLTMINIAFSLGVRESSKNKNVMLSEVNDALMRKLYAVETKNIDEDLWDYFCQLTEELRKKSNLKKALREIRAKKLSSN